MDRREAVILGAIVLLLFTVFFWSVSEIVRDASAHETETTIKHLERGETLGPDIIYVYQCSEETWLLMADTDRNSSLDICYYAWGDHDTVHYVEFKPPCSCTAGKEIKNDRE